ncbi:hypothetical protein JG688_00001236 [Phytophthora aleatoria]|uniref:Transmembrane protein n=1 Tax=Phytophthora aleatoria TaxID=2496075 RepID=A0A8J5JBP5_9STRA|nr:hypothetical protein JG688_00001236 [Phytophthora aleatoria]
MNTITRAKQSPQTAQKGLLFSKRPSTHCRTRAKQHEWQKLLLRPDIGNHLALSKLRCTISIISLLLLVTDIPRSGLGVENLSDYYPAHLMPDTATRFGPYAYPVTHIRRSANSTETFEGLDGTNPVESASVWAYQYDTTSLGLRGAVELLNVTDFPKELLYRGELRIANNQKGVISLRTAFFMLDAFISAAQAQFLTERATSDSTGFRFATRHDWVDRIHQYLTRFVKPRQYWSLHSLHVPRTSPRGQSLAFCSTARQANSPSRPRFCSNPGSWKCENPINASLPQVRLRDHLDLRFQDLQRRYPALVLDVALLATHRPLMTSGTLSYTFFNFEEQEIVVLTRGRNCTQANEGVKCSTVFVDDYRYERGTLETNIVDWYFFVAMMRGSAQGYFWIRLFLLYRTAFIAARQTEAGQYHWYSRVVPTGLIVLKIPFQVIVYSSPLPVTCYVVGLLLDGNFMDIFLDSYWSSLEGATNFEIVSFFNSTITQMRTVWLIALVVGLIGFMARKHRSGLETKLPGIRGLVISFTSALTVFGPYKQTSFRFSKIVGVIRLSNVGQTMTTVQAVPQWYFNESTYLFDDSMTILFFWATVVAGVASIARVVANLMGIERELVLVSTRNAPCGTENLWPASALSIRFETQPSAPQPRIAPETLTVASKKIGTFRIAPFPSCGVNTPQPRQVAEVPTLGLSSWLSSSKQKLLSATKSVTPRPSGFHSRTAESHSILQLMNIAMMTDPLNFFWLRVVGIPLYLYRIGPTPSDSSSLLPYAVILPYSEDEMEENTGLSSGDFQLLDSVSSRDVPMLILLQCG